MATAMMAAITPLRPIVAVIGTTGVGKSQLAVKLAQSVSAATSHGSSAAVLSADSMQLYKGLDVITNKVTEEEKGGIPHWGLDVVQPGKGGSWEVGKWCGEADKEISSLAVDTLPIVCGGTHYFIQHFLFPPSELSFSRPESPRLADGKGKQSHDPRLARWKPLTPRPAIPHDLDRELESLMDTFWTADPSWPIPSQPLSGPSSQSTRITPLEQHQLLSLHRLLAAVDPKEAGRWHWRDGRKVKRGLERWWENGGLGTVESAGAEKPKSGRRARFKTLIFWVYEPIETLRPRLDSRVDRMVENGLLREIAELRAIAESIYGSTDAVDHTEGIFQAIGRFPVNDKAYDEGYKEFAQLPLPQSCPESSPRFAQMLERTKLSTHQYAKSQIKWIRNQLLPAAREARALGDQVEVYVVPGGPAGEGVAQEILSGKFVAYGGTCGVDRCTSAFLLGQPIPDARTTGHPAAESLLAMLYETVDDSFVPDTAARQLLNSRRDCGVCSLPGLPYSVGEREWEDHLRSKAHRKQDSLARGGKEARIREQKEKGLSKRAERAAIQSRLLDAVVDA
ncbi:tRNA dimethylallyltransferase, partial [Tremellales sp. Uapishka_1]